ncbi:MAG: 50S ribosomal protein L21e [Candidatus Geothermarchaeota archaeon]
MPSSKGYRVKTRKLLTKEENEGFSDRLLLLQNAKIGDKVVIKIDPSYHKGMPHRRYHGLVGTIVGRRGRAFEVKVTKGNKEVLLIIPFEHLRLFKGVKNNV